MINDGAEAPPPRSRLISPCASLLARPFNTLAIESSSQDWPELERMETERVERKRGLDLDARATTFLPLKDNFNLGRREILRLFPLPSWPAIICSNGAIDKPLAGRERRTTTKEATRLGLLTFPYVPRVVAANYASPAGGPQTGNETTRVSISFHIYVYTRARYTRALCKAGGPFKTGRLEAQSD